MQFWRRWQNLRFKENLKLVVSSAVEEQEIDTESHEKTENFSFVKC